MLYRPERGFIASAADACYDCGRYIGGQALCGRIGAHLVQPLPLGMTLDIVHCPERQDCDHMRRRGQGPGVRGSG